MKHIITTIILLLTVGVQSAVNPLHGETGDAHARLAGAPVLLAGQGVFRVDTESGHGSGFLVDSKRGLIATNYHVVRLGSGLSRFISVAIPHEDGSETRIEATVLYANAQKDIAVLKVHPARTADLQSIRIPEQDTLSVLDPVVAIGSPLSLGLQYTRGYISNLGSSYGTGDFLAQPGNSGGPLVLAETGGLAGVVTFGSGGSSGFVRVNIVRDALHLNNFDRSIREPSPDPLPSYAFPGPYPAELLLERTLAAHDQRKNRKSCESDFGKHPFDWSMEWCNEVGNDRFRINVDTPVTSFYHHLTEGLHREENRRRRRGKDIEDATYRESLHSYEWFNTTTRTNSALAPAVSVHAYPKVGQTGGSIAKQIAGAAIAGAISGATGVYVPSQVGANLKFKGEFHALRVTADGEELIPIRRSRHLYQVQQEGFIEMRDEAYAGTYQYNMEDFVNAEEIVIEIFEARRPDKPMDKKFKLEFGDLVMKQIRSDYAALKAFHEDRNGLRHTGAD